jgi:hypothetical protein
MSETIYDVNMETDLEMEDAVDRVMVFLLDNRASIGTILALPGRVRENFPPYLTAKNHPEMISLRNKIKASKEFKTALYERISRHNFFGVNWAKKLFVVFEN